MVGRKAADGKTWKVSRKARSKAAMQAQSRNEDIQESRQARMYGSGVRNTRTRESV